MNNGIYEDKAEGVRIPLVGDCSVLVNATAAQSTAPLSAVFSDGTSNTVYLSESYARTSVTDYFMYRLDRPTKPSQVSIPLLGNVTSYDSTRQATFADEGQGDVHPVTTGFPPVTHGQLPQQTIYDPPPGMGIGVTPETLFQCGVPPQEARGKVPYSPYPGGLQCSFADGSVRFIRRSVDESAFWGAVTPAGGEVSTLD